MTDYVLDTNIISLILRADANVTSKYRAISAVHVIIACPMVWYEVRRGLLAKDAKGQMQVFRKLHALFVWQDYTPTDFDLAAQLWVQRKTAGRPIADADLLIAVFAMNRDAILVTDNEKDFDGLGLKVENWKQS